jgi:ABC-type multidrug transport system fused ATPase/permease subunit
MSEQPMSLRQIVAFALGLLQRRERVYLYLALFLQIILGFADIIGVLVLGIVSSEIVENYIGSGNSNSGILTSAERLLHFENLNLLQMASIAVAIFVSKALFALAFTWKLYIFLSKRADSISRSFLNNFLNTPFVSVRKMDNQRLPFAFMEGVNALVIGVISNLILLITDFAVLLILFVGLIRVNLSVTLMVAVIFGLLGYFLTKFLTPSMKLFGRLSAELSNQGRGAILDIKEMFQEFPNREKSWYFKNKAQQIREKSSAAYAREQWLGGLPKNVLETAAIMGIFFILIAASFTGSTQSNVGIVTVFLGATARIVPAILRMQANWLSIVRNVGYVNEAMPIFTLISTPVKEKDSPSELRENRTKFVQTGDIDFLNVSYRYPDSDHDVISGLTFNVRSGEKIAIVGDSGAGKTTVANLILGLLTPTGGRIVSGANQENLENSSYATTGYLPQVPYIFSGTILLNVCLTEVESEIDYERFNRAIHDAQIADFVLSQPSQWLSILGAGGLTLSGGESQRLALARVLYLQPSILVLDEPTSSLDAETDEFVSRTLMDDQMNSTVLVIAHKYSTVRSADKILYLQNGRSVAFGDWDSVVAQVPRFALQARIQGT